MLDFKEIELSDKKWVDPLLKYSDFRGCEYNFGTMFIWRFVHHSQIARMDDLVIICSGDEKKSFLYPAGKGDVEKAVVEMKSIASSFGQPLRIHIVNAQSKKLLEQLFPNKFSYTLSRDYFDYIYDTEKLITLSGKKLHSKRNYINRFLAENDGNWKFEFIDENNIEECLEMNRHWCIENNCLENDSKLEELSAVAQAFRHYKKLGLNGGLIRLEGKVIAFTMGEPLNSDTYLIHIEKGFSNIRGAYPMINQQFAASACSEFKFINREDDSGFEGLRKAKLSYRPVFLEEKYLAESID